MTNHVTECLKLQIRIVEKEAEAEFTMTGKF